jgi:serine/threonine-protein kinase RsbW
VSSAGQPDIEVEIPPRPEYVGVVRHLMGAVARLGLHSPEFVENAKLAGSEASTNAVALTGLAGVDERVRVTASLSEAGLEIVVSDRGGAAQDAPVISNGSSEAATGFDSGLSLPLLEGLVDDLSIEPRDGGGSEVRMTLIRDLEEGDG